MTATTYEQRDDSTLKNPEPTAPPLIQAPHARRQVLPGAQLQHRQAHVPESQGPVASTSRPPPLPAKRKSSSTWRSRSASDTPLKVSLPTAESQMAVRPFYKWAGGKAKLVPKLIEILGKQRLVDLKQHAYHEPFLGGGALALELMSHGAAAKYWLSDVNEELITTWRVFRGEHRHSGQLRQTVEVLKNMPVNEDHYYAVRDIDHKRLRYEYEQAARFLYLNRFCFNGLYRVNQKGLFNSPWGKPRRAAPSAFDFENFDAVHQLLGSHIVELNDWDFNQAENYVEAGDIIYFDPPYVPTSITSSFTTYTAGGFTKTHHECLAEVARHAAGRRAHVMLSNSDTPLVRGLYKKSDGWHLTKIQAARAISGKGASRGKVGELIITSFKPGG
jgi:DNA adenine methylase